MTFLAVKRRNYLLELRGRNKKKFYYKKKKKFKNSLKKKSIEIFVSLKKKKHFLNFFKKNNIFIFYRRLFNYFNKAGKKNLTIKMFINFINFLLKQKKKLKNKFKSAFIYINLYKIVYNINPIFAYTHFYLKGDNLLLPTVRLREKFNGLKLTKIAVA